MESLTIHNWEGTEMEKQDEKKSGGSECSMVLYCLLRRPSASRGRSEFLLVTKQGYPTFPPTKFRPGEDLYSAMVRPMEEDLGLPPGCYFPEEELPVIPNAGESPRYPGLSKRWDLYPVVVSLTDEGLAALEKATAGGRSVLRPLKPHWWCLEEVLERAEEPNVQAIATFLRDKPTELLQKPPGRPSMEALACSWAARHRGGVRVVRDADIRRIIDAGPRAFNLRVADPYLPYQKQGLGFTWSFFTPKDMQDVHVHGLPAVEIYGVLEGRLQLWHKPMEQRGVAPGAARRCRRATGRKWNRCTATSPAGWIAQGLGTVIKAAGSGELAGVGRLGISGKTTCKDCNVKRTCLVPPDMARLLAEYEKPYEQRDYHQIATLAESAEFRTRL